MKKMHKEPEKNGIYSSESRQLAEMNVALAESESSYRSIFEHATDAIYIQDENLLHQGEMT